MRSYFETASSRSSVDETSSDWAVAFFTSPHNCFAFERVRQAISLKRSRLSHTNCDVIFGIASKVIKSGFGNKAGTKKKNFPVCKRIITVKRHTYPYRNSLQLTSPTTTRF